MRKLVAVFLFVVFTAFLALAANPADDVKKADQDWKKVGASKNVDQFMSFIADDAYVSGNDGKWGRRQPGH